MKYMIPVLIVSTLATCFGCPPLQAASSTPRTAALPDSIITQSHHSNNSIRKGHSLSRWNDDTALSGHASMWPAAAEDCAMIYDPLRHSLVIFGGKGDADYNIGETWILNLDNRQWQNITSPDVNPPAAEDHTAIYDPVSYSMVVFGGEDGPTWNETWILDLATYRWRDITLEDTPRREDHTAIYDSQGKRMVVFAGRDNDAYDLSNILTLDLNPASPTFEQWQELSFEGKKNPAGRSDHVAVYDSLKNRMVIYSGWKKKEKKYLGDTWKFSFDNNRWKKIKTKKSFPPQRRHAMGAYDSEHNWFIIFGGFGKAGYLNDVWAFDLSQDIWINITPGPQPRLDHHIAFDPTSGRVLLYGGDARGMTKFHDLWELEISSDISPDLFKAAKGKKRKKLKKLDMEALK